MQSRSRLVYEEWDLCIPGVRSLGKYQYAAAQPGLPPHQHHGCVEISMLVKGHQCYQIGGSTYHVQGGDQYISLPDEIHDTSAEPEEKGIMYWLILDVRRRDGEFLFLTPGIARDIIGALTRLTHRHFTAHAESRATLDRAFSALPQTGIPTERTGIFQNEAGAGHGGRKMQGAKAKKMGRDFAWVEASNQLVSYVLQTIHASITNPRGISPEIRASLEYMGKNADSALNVKKIAEAFEVSESSFKSRFRKEIGLPPAEYMLRQKIKIAKEQLKKNGAAITDVAHGLGFCSSQYFATVFKRYTCLTPSEFVEGSRPAVIEFVQQ